MRVLNAIFIAAIFLFILNRLVLVVAQEQNSVSLPSYYILTKEKDMIRIEYPHDFIVSQGSTFNSVAFSIIGYPKIMEGWEISDLNDIDKYVYYRDKIKTNCEAPELCGFFYQQIDIAYTLASQDAITDAMLKLELIKNPIKVTIPEGYVEQYQITDGKIKCDGNCVVGNLIDEKKKDLIEIKNVEIKIGKDKTLIRSSGLTGEEIVEHRYNKKTIKNFKCVYYEKGHVTGGYTFECEENLPLTVGIVRECPQNLLAEAWQKVFDFFLKKIAQKRISGTVNLFNENCAIEEAKLEENEFKYGKSAILRKGGTTHILANADPLSIINAEFRGAWGGKIRITNTEGGFDLTANKLAMKVRSNNNDRVKIIRG